MLTGFIKTPSYSLLPLSLSIISTFGLQVRAAVQPSSHSSSDHHYHAQRGPNNNPLDIDWDPAPSAEDGPAGAAYALRDPAYLPAQIAGIVGSYAFSLVVVALLLLALSKKRREHLRAAEELEEVWDRHHSQVFDYGEGREDSDRQQGPYPVPTFNDDYLEDPPSYRDGVYQVRPVSITGQLLIPEQVHGHVRNFSLPSPTATKFEIPTLTEVARLEEPYQATSPASYFLPSPTSTTRGPIGQDPEVPQDVVQRDRSMAQAELEQMYKYVMEQEEAKEAGVEFRAPMVPAQPRDSTMTSSSHKREKNKPANLNLANPEKKESRTSSFLSALKSPGRKKKQPVGISISSPIMTPMSGTFPQYVGEEMSAIPPRQYAPAIPPPVPMNHSQASFASRRNTGHIAPLMTPPDLSPESTQSIDERLGGMAKRKGSGSDEYHSDDENDEGQDQVGNMQPHSRHISVATTADGADPVSAISDTGSQAALLRTTTLNAPGVRTSGLPTSPKPGVNRFPSLPSSPKPGASFASQQRAGPSSAVRTGGMLPLRAYENAMVASPTTGQFAPRTTETVFQRAGPMSPGGMHTARTPMTGMAVPYSPYQPFSPVVPITPGRLVTRADRKQMRRMEPKTPTLQMVKSDDDLW